MEMIMNMPVMLLLTIGAYLLGVWVKKKSGLALMHPFLISIPVIVAVLEVTVPALLVTLQYRVVVPTAFGVNVYVELVAPPTAVPFLYHW